MVQLASVIFLFGALFIHEICGTIVWTGNNYQQRRESENKSANPAEPALKFTPGSENDHKHHARHRRSLWQSLKEWVMTLFGKIPSDQEISERLKALGEMMKNISEHGGPGYPNVGQHGLGEAFFPHDEEPGLMYPDPDELK